MDHYRFVSKTFQKKRRAENKKEWWSHVTVGKSHQMGLTSFDKLSMEKKKSIKWIKPTAKRTIRAREKRNQLRQRQRIKVKKTTKRITWFSFCNGTTQQTRNHAQLNQMYVLDIMSFCVDFAFSNSCHEHLLAKNFIQFILCAFWYVCVCMGTGREVYMGTGWKIWALSIKKSYESTLLNVICRNEFPEFRVPFDFMCHFVGCWVLEFLSISLVQPNHKHYVYDNCVICCSFDFTCQLFLSLDVEDFAQLAWQQQWQPGRERQRRRQHLISFYRIPPELPNVSIASNEANVLRHLIPFDWMVVRSFSNRNLFFSPRCFL